MISNVNKNVIFVKNIPSNVIEEAIFILKEDVSDNKTELRLDIAKDEAELILQEYVDTEIVNDLKLKNSEEKKKRKLKSIFVIAMCMFGFLISLISSRM